MMLKFIKTTLFTTILRSLITIVNAPIMQEEPNDYNYFKDVSKDVNMEEQTLKALTRFLIHLMISLLFGVFVFYKMNIYLCKPDQNNPRNPGQIGRVHNFGNRIPPHRGIHHPVLDLPHNLQANPHDPKVQDRLLAYLRREGNFLVRHVSGSRPPQRNQEAAQIPEGPKQ